MLQITLRAKYKMALRKPTLLAVFSMDSAVTSEHLPVFLHYLGFLTAPSGSLLENGETRQ